MSKLGFDKTIKGLNAKKKQFLKAGISLARKEFAKNFNSESNAETGKSWDAVLRGYPPPILDVTGELKSQAIKGGTLIIKQNSAHLTINPLDDRGREYAAYHQEGTDQMPQRQFVTQSRSLTIAQKKLLDNILD